jgi:Tetratricopeptide repeat
VLPLRALVAPVILACLSIRPAGATAVAAAPGPIACALELRARDASGNTVLTTVAYALDRPGLVLAPLSAAARLRTRWQRLQTVPDPGPAGPGDGRAPIDVTEVLLQDASRDLVLLRAPGLEACDRKDDGVADGPAATAPVPAEGDTLLGLRDRDGYRPRVFQARLDRMIALGAGPELLRVRIPDGGGAGSGFLFDRRHRLFGSILPPPPGGDRQFACAVPIDRRVLDVAASGPGLPVSDALARPADDFARSAAGLWAQALLLTRDDQADQALRLLDDVARLSGDSDILMLERGGRLFRIGRTDAAIADFERAARLSPRLHLARFNLGVAYGAAGRYDEAIDSFTRALEIEPLHAQTHFQLALALMAAHRVEGARRECDSLERIDKALARDLRAALSF